MSNHLTSISNPKIKQLVKLKKKRERDQQQLFPIEGYREIQCALESHCAFHSLFISPSFFLGSNEAALIDRIAQSAPVYVCAPAVFSKISYRDRPDGLIAVGYQWENNLDTLHPSPSALYLLVESIEKPGNLGTILRSGDAVGVDAVIVCDECTDIFNPNVVRSSVGTLFSLHIIQTSSIQAKEWLHFHHIPIISAVPQANTTFTQCNFTDTIALAVGSEQYGLSSHWTDGIDKQVSIPMLGKADSLNVAMATTILLYEVWRQRQGKQ